MRFKANLHIHEGLGEQRMAEEPSNLIGASQAHLLSGLPQGSNQPRGQGGSLWMALQTEGAVPTSKGMGSTTPCWEEHLGQVRGLLWDV